MATTRRPSTSPRTGRDGEGAGSDRRADLLRIAGDLFAQKGYRSTTVREIADAAGILSGSLYHHFDSKESIGDELLSRFMDDVLTGCREAVAAGGDARTVIERIVRTSVQRLNTHRAALTMLENDWAYMSSQPRFSHLQRSLREIERIWVAELERGQAQGVVHRELDPKLTYRLLRTILWTTASWRRPAGHWSASQVVDTVLRLVFHGISA